MWALGVGGGQIPGRGLLLPAHQPQHHRHWARDGRMRAGPGLWLSADVRTSARGFPYTTIDAAVESSRRAAAVTRSVSPHA